MEIRMRRSAADSGLCSVFASGALASRGVGWGGPGGGAAEDEKGEDVPVEVFSPI